MEPFHVFSTTADVGIVVRGKTFAQLYRHAVLGFNQLVLGKPVASGAELPADTRCFRYEGDSPENVLVRLLSEVSYLLYSKQRAVEAVTIPVAGRRYVRARLDCRPLKEMPLMEIKSVTYHNLNVTDKAGVLEAGIVFDV